MFVMAAQKGLIVECLNTIIVLKTRIKNITEFKSEARIGIRLSQEEIYNINNIITPLIKEQHQSINHVFINNPDLLYFSKPTFYPEKNKRIKETIAELMEIKSICKRYNIQLVLFMTPTHITTYLSDDIRNFNEFKYELAQVSDFYDFSTINFYTTNNYFWGETSHTGKFLEEAVTDELLGREDKRGILKDNICAFVTKENVGEHLKKMLEDREKYNEEGHMQYVPE